MVQQRRDWCGARLAFETLEQRLVLSGDGLTAQYFHNSDFTGLAETRIENIAHNWGTGAPVAGVAADSFSVRWTGQIAPTYSETYTFNVLSDEGVRLWVDGQLVIDDWTAHARRNRTGAIALQAGQRYDIRLDYYENTGAAQIELSWSSASQASQIVPASALYESPAGLLGAYSDTAGHSVSRVDPSIDFDWGTAAADPALNADGFNATWSGQIRADYSEQYTFSTISDERVRLWIGDELILDYWTPHTSTERFGTKLLEAGKWYDVRLEYQDDTGPANVAWRWSSDRQTGFGVFQTVPTSSLRAAKETPVTFRNPLGVGADPFVVRENDYYYMTMTTNGRSVSIIRAKALQDIHDSSPNSDTVLAWSAPTGTAYSSQVWAPELHHIGASWYIYVAASDGNNANHHMYVLERDAPDPFGAFYFKGQLAAITDRWAIDGTALEWQGKLYFVWSGWPGTTDGQQNLYIAEMRNPWTLSTTVDRVLISSPTYAWERNGLPINEGPEVIINNGQLHIIYSASGYWTNQYALGRLTYNGTGSLLSAGSWTKASQPVFAATSLVTGVGHASFTTSPDGTENWIVYHAHANPAVFNEDRVVSIQPFTFAANGTPNFGAPLAPSQAIAAPSGLAQANRVAAAGDFNADGVIDTLDYSTWRATLGMPIFPGTSADGNGSGSVEAADFVLWRKRSAAQGVGSGPAAEASGGSLSIAIAAGSADSGGNAFDAKATSKSQLAVANAMPLSLSQSSMNASAKPLSRRTFATERLTDVAFGNLALMQADEHNRRTIASDGDVVRSYEFALRTDRRSERDTDSFFASQLADDFETILAERCGNSL